MALARRSAHHLASTGGGAGRGQIVGGRRLEPISGGYQRSVHRGACGAGLQTPRAGRRANRQILRRLSPVCLTQLHTGLRGLRPRRSARPRIFAGETSGTARALFAPRERGRLTYLSSRAGASVARMERSAIRVIVSGAGKSRISLRFMRATDSCAGVFLLPWREKVASPRLAGACEGKSGLHTQFHPALRRGGGGPCATWWRGGRLSSRPMTGACPTASQLSCARAPLARPGDQGYLGSRPLPSSSGPGRRPLTAKTGVRVP